MAWAIITIYTSKCAQMDPQQLRKTSKFYSRSKKCDIEKTLGGGYHPPLVARMLIKCFSFEVYGLRVLFCITHSAWSSLPLTFKLVHVKSYTGYHWGPSHSQFLYNQTTRVESRG